MLAVSLSDRLTAMIAVVSPLAVRVERFWLLCSAVLSREYFTEASVRNFPKQCTRQGNTGAEHLTYLVFNQIYCWDCSSSQPGISLQSIIVWFTSNLNLPSCLSLRLTRGQFCEFMVYQLHKSLWGILKGQFTPKFNLNVFFCPFWRQLTSYRSVDCSDVCHLFSIMEIMFSYV